MNTEKGEEKGEEWEKSLTGNDPELASPTARVVSTPTSGSRRKSKVSKYAELRGKLKRENVGTRAEAAAQAEGLPLIGSNASEISSDQAQGLTPLSGSEIEFRHANPMAATNGSDGASSQFRETDMERSVRRNSAMSGASATSAASGAARAVGFFGQYDEDDVEEEQGPEIGDASSATGSLMDETKKQLEDLQLRTIYTLVENCEVEANGVGYMRKLLFLTNKQARKFDFGNIDKFLNAFDVSPQPKLIINLVASFATVTALNENDCHLCKLKADELSPNGTYYSEKKASDVEATDRAIATFLEESLLPVAIHTNALVLVQNDQCSLAMAIGKLCESELAKSRTGKLPFTVLFIGSATSVFGPALEQLKNQSKRFKEKDEAIHSALINTWGEERIKWSTKQEPPPGCSHYVIVDGVTRGKVDNSAGLGFKNTFVQHLSTNLPSIAVTTLSVGSIDRFGFLADYVGRGLPLLLVDSRPEPKGGYPTSVEAAKASLLHLDEELAANGAINTYSASTLAFLRQVLRKSKPGRQGSNGRESTHQLLWTLIDAHHNKEREQQQAAMKRRASISQGVGQQQPVKEDYDAEQRENKELKEAVELFIELNKSAHDRMLASNLALMDRRLESLATCQTLAELSAWLSEISEAVYIEAGDEGAGGDRTRSKECARLFKIQRDHPDLFATIQVRKGRMPYCSVLQLSSELDESNVDEIKRILGDTVGGWRDKTTEPNVRLQLPPREFPVDAYMQLRRLLSSDNVYAGNVFEPGVLLEQVNRVARIDRLPSTNSPEALEILRVAWDSVDIFSQSAKHFKGITKFCFRAQLFLGVFTTCLVTFTYNEPDHFEQEQLKVVVVAISLLGTTLAAASTYLNPGTKWLQLRGAALAIESEIWLFRTRTGSYSLSQSKETMADLNAEERLYEFVESVNHHVMKSASVAETPFYAKFKVLEDNSLGKLNRFTHGQYKGARICGTFGTANRAATTEDDHQSPTKPAEYLKLRVLPLLKFYQVRLPLYYRVRTTIEVLLVLGGICTTLLGFLNLQGWTPVVASLVGTMMAWLEFNGTSKKLSRYSDVVHQVNSLILWWKRLTDVDRASLANIEQLIMSGEEMFATERQAWLSTSMVMKSLSNKSTFKAEKNKRQAEEENQP